MMIIVSYQKNKLKIVFNQNITFNKNITAKKFNIHIIEYLKYF